MYFAILSYFGKPSLMVALSTLAGFFLLSLAYISFGMFASSITENQIVASVITIGAFLAMYAIKILGDKAFKKESLGGGDIKLMFLL